MWLSNKLYGQKVSLKISAKMDDSSKKNKSERETALTKLDKDQTALLVIDVQDKLIQAIDKKEIILSSIKKLIAASNILQFNKFFTEQNPMRLGSTINLLVENESIHPYSKMDFSCTACDELMRTLENKNIKNLVLCGIESHICVQQTAIDLIRRGYIVFIVIDAIGSRKAIDNDAAIRRLEMSGAIATTSESIIFEWCRTAERKEFKAISSLIK